MPELTEIGKRIVLKHKPTGETHFGTVFDVKDIGYVVEMDETARLYCEDDFLVDTECYADKWEVVRLLDD